MVQPQPGSAFIMVQAEFVLELLMCLLAGHRALIARTSVLRGVSAGWLVKEYLRSPLERASHPSQAACPGRCCPYETRSSSAIRVTRTVAKWALSRHFVPRRHEQRRKALAPRVSIICTTDTLGTDGRGYLAGRPTGGLAGTVSAISAG